MINKQKLPVISLIIYEGAANLGWDSKNVVDELSELINLPVVVGNDANVAALGEMWMKLLLVPVAEPAVLSWLHQLPE